MNNRNRNSGMEQITEVTTSLLNPSPTISLPTMTMANTMAVTTTVEGTETASLFGAAGENFSLNLSNGSGCLKLDTNEGTGEIEINTAMKKKKWIP